jgi:hypothetical protein
MEITSYTELLGDMAKNSSTQSYTPQLDKCNLVQEVNHIKLLLQKKMKYTYLIVQSTK